MYEIHGNEHLGIGSIVTTQYIHTYWNTEFIDGFMIKNNIIVFLGDFVICYPIRSGNIQYDLHS